MSGKPNKLLIEDTLYDITPAYIEGAMAMRHNISHHFNPHKGDDESDWSYGHDHEAAGEHHRFGRDILQDAPAGREIMEDPALSRDTFGNVCEKPTTSKTPGPI